MGETIKLWRCQSCNRVLREQPITYALQRHAEMVAAQAGAAADFVREATWSAYLASMRRCRCGSRKRFRPLPPTSLRGQLDLGIDAVVLQ
jgi:hypothetical protein